MENASKALIIAGAILLSILIIALGIYVFNMAKNATNTSSLDELEISQFNQEYTNYRGRKLGSMVVELLDKVIAGATTYKDSDERLPDIIYIETRTSGGVNKIGNLTGGAAGTGDAANALSDEGVTLASGSKMFWIKSDSGDRNTNQIAALRRQMASKHYYEISFHNNNDTSLIDFIIIQY